MNIKEFKKIVQQGPESTKFSISEPFSWRGSYDEVCFTIIDKKGTKKDILENINLACEGSFEGWKGGTYSYDAYTTVNFESEEGSYTGGDYCTRMIEKYSNEAHQPDSEVKLVTLLTRD